MAPIKADSFLKIPDLDIYLERVEQYLKKNFDDHGSVLNRSTLRLLSTKRKLIRPGLVICAAVSQGQLVNEEVIRGCLAVELVHLGSLIHDDIIDSAKERWGLPTLNSKEGINTAILAGDYLLAEAGVNASGISKEIAKLISSTISIMCDGQSRELNDLYNVKRSERSLLLTMSRKTASLISAACQIGGLCAGAASSVVDDLKIYGHYFGLSFQMIDDLIDCLSLTGLTGKNGGSDLKNGVYTLPVILGLKGPNRSKLLKLIRDNSEESRQIIVDTLSKDGSIERTISKVKQSNQSAVNSLSKLKSNPALDQLKQLPSNYLIWALSELGQ